MAPRWREQIGVQMSASPSATSLVPPKACLGLVRPRTSHTGDTAFPWRAARMELATWVTPKQWVEAARQVQRPRDHEVVNSSRQSATTSRFIAIDTKLHCNLVDYFRAWFDEAIKYQQQPRTQLRTLDFTSPSPARHTTRRARNLPAPSAQAPSRSARSMRTFPRASCVFKPALTAYGPVAG